MASRGWTAVLLLFAVLAMHGLQCGSAADGAAHDGSTPLVTVAAMAAPAAGDAHHGHAAAHPSTPLAPGQDGATAATLDGGHDGAPLHGTGHLWAVCLAVLAAGLALLLALILPRRVALAPAALSCAVHRAAGSLPLPRPPDLHALCLLRT
jgi:hypothetical protein